MHGFPTWTTDARRFHGGALLTLTLFVTSSFAGTNLPELQALGARIKLASAQVGAGHPPSAGSLIAFGRELSLLGDTISAGGDARIRQKHQAVLLLLATLQ